jgi:hypothetical protein
VRARANVLAGVVAAAVIAALPARGAAQRSDITVRRRGEAAPSPAPAPPSPPRPADGSTPSPPRSGGAGARAEATSALDRRRSAIAKELVALGTELRREIVRGDAAALLARVPAAGLRCAGRVVPRPKVARDLRTSGAWLHDVLFALGPGARGAPASLAELLRTSREVAVVVTFREDPASGPTGLPCLDYRVKGVATPGAPLCFERVGGRWWFAESLYPCG